MTPGFGNPAPAYRWATWLSIALLAIIVWQFLGIASLAATRNLEFDGGMNLEVAKSIANGEGPRGRYDDADFYPAGVQSKEPFYLVAAAVYKIGGVGPVQGQVTNLVFLCALLVIVVAIVRRAMNLATGLLAACFVLAMPRLSYYGLHGYGEVATLVFGLGAMAVLAWPTRLDAHGSARAFFAGMLGALAIATKVVGVVQFGAIGCLLVARVLMDAAPGARFRDTIRSGVVFAAGAAVPLVAIELWRMWWLGLQGYEAWWDFQIAAIGTQAGAVPREAQATWLDKIPAHFGVLAKELAARPLATAALLVLPLVSAATVLLRHARTKSPQGATRAWITFALALVAVVYIPWWLAYVPDEKAWVRYFMIALLALAILAGMGVAGHARDAWLADSRWRRAGHAALAIGLLAVFVPFVWRSLPKERLPSSPNEEVQAQQWAAALISKLPDDRLVFGFGWYAAPVIQLYADRRFYDLTDFPIGTLVHEPQYIVADRQTLTVDILAPVLARYPYRKLMRDNPNAQVYEVDFAHPNDPFADMDTRFARSHVDFATVDYPLVDGYLPWVPSGGRPAWSDSEVLLRYSGESKFALVAYMALPSYYLRPQPLRGRIVIDGCPPMPFAFEGTGWKQFMLDMPCKPAHGEVRVRMLLDNVFDLPWEKVHQEAILVRSLGFAR